MTHDDQVLHRRLKRRMGSPWELLVLCPMLGCSSVSAIQLRDAATIEARIDRSDREFIYVTPAEGERQQIDRRNVVSIDHPGKAGMVVGAVCSIVSAGSFVLSSTLHAGCGQGGCLITPSGFFYLEGVLGLGCALPALAVGFGAYMRSWTAARGTR